MQVVSKFHATFLSTVLAYGMVWYGMVRYGMVYSGMVWYGMQAPPRAEGA